MRSQSLSLALISCLLSVVACSGGSHDASQPETCAECEASANSNQAGPGAAEAAQESPTATPSSPESDLPLEIESTQPAGSGSTSRSD